MMRVLIIFGLCVTTCACSLIDDFDDFYVGADAAVADASDSDAAIPDCEAPLIGCPGGCFDLDTDVARCGSCDNPCAAPNSTPICAMGDCDYTICDTDFDDCDADRTNGCEADLLNDPATCGDCLTACSLPNAVEACVGGVCAVGSCDEGWADCNGVAFDGCEVNLTTDDDNCGVCDRRCTAGVSCVSSACEDDIVDIAVGCGHSCAVMGGGHTLCWGDDTFGQLGNGAGGDSSTPVRVEMTPDQEAVQVATGSYHACARLRDGRLICWGNNNNGRLGSGSFVGTAAAPVYVSGFDMVDTADADQLVAGRSGNSCSFGVFGGAHSCVIRSDATLWCWGANGSGQLGVGDSTERRRPRQVIGLSDVSTVSAGGRHTCAVRADQTAVCWGRDTFGRLGNGAGSPRLQPSMPVAGLTAVTAIDATIHTCAVHDGRLSCWGWNQEGQLGDGTTDDRSTPVEPLLPGRAGDVVAVTTGEGLCPEFIDDDSGGFTCALTQPDASTTAVWCWGDPTDCQLGDCAVADPAPFEVPGMDDVAQIAAGCAKVCARTNDQRVICWGSGEAPTEVTGFGGPR